MGPHCAAKAQSILKSIADMNAKICVVLLLGLSIIASIAMPTDEIVPTDDIVPETGFQEQEEATGCLTSFSKNKDGIKNKCVGCLSPCLGKKKKRNRKRNKLCCKRKTGEDQCKAEGGTFCGAPEEKPPTEEEKLPENPKEDDDDDKGRRRRRRRRRKEDGRRRRKVDGRRRRKKI